MPFLATVKSFSTPVISRRLSLSWMGVKLPQCNIVRGEKHIGYVPLFGEQSVRAPYWTEHGRHRASAQPPVNICDRLVA